MLGVAALVIFLTLFVITLKNSADIAARKAEIAALNLPAATAAQIDALMKKVGSSLNEVKAATELDLSRNSLNAEDAKYIAQLLSSGLAPKLSTLE